MSVIPMAGSGIPEVSKIFVLESGSVLELRAARKAASQVKECGSLKLWPTAKSIT